MLRSKQLLPFVKGARAWIVAGSVSKPPPLDGTVNSAGNEDSKTEQGFSGTRSSRSPKSPLHIYRAEDGSFGKDIKRAVVSSAGRKVENIYESSGGAFIPGATLSRRSGAHVAGTIPTKDVGIVSPAAVKLESVDVVLPATVKQDSVDVILPTAVKHDSKDNGRPGDLSDPALSQDVPGHRAITPQILVSRNETTRKTVPIVARKSEVGLASLSGISDKEVISKREGRATEAERLEGQKSVIPLARSSRTAVVVSNSGAPAKALPSKEVICDSGHVEAKPSPNFARNELPVPGGSTKPSAWRGKKSQASEARRESAIIPDGAIIFGTVNSPVVRTKNFNDEAGVSDNRKSIKPSASLQRSTARPVRTTPKNTIRESNVVIQSGGQMSDVVGQKSLRSSKGRDGGTGVSSNRRRGNNFPNAGGIRQSHWSARDTGASSEMVDQVGSILQRMGWTSQTVDALASLNSRLSTFHINEVLKHQREPGLAWEFFKWAKTQSGYKHDVRTYTTMIGILGRVRNFEACDRLLIDMRMEGCEPSVVTFNRLIHSYGRANNLREALNLFHKMQEVGVQPDRVTYCTLMDLYSKAGFHDIAMDLCQKMWQAGFEPDTFSYTVIINCLGKAGNLPAAFKLFLEMIDSGHTPNLVTYNTMIDLHAKAGKHQMALKLYNDMQDSGFRPDNVTYSVIMEVLGHSGHLDEAENVFFEMEQAGWSADATTFGSLVYMWGQTGNVKKATEWYKRMLQSGLSPNVPTCNSLLWAYMRVNDYVAAQEVLDSMPKWGLSPTLPTYTLLLSSFTTCDNQQDVDFTLQIMSRTGHLAHTFLCRLLNETDSRVSRLQVHQFFASLHEEEQENKRSFADALIEFLYKLDHKGRAGSVWEIAMENNLYPSALSQRSPNFWILDLHVMSMGTAVVALLKTLASLREQMLSTGVVPDRIEIVTGWGRHSRVSGFSKIKNVVDSVLGALHAPFHVDSSNVGCFVGSGQSLTDWFHEPDMDNRLAL